MQNNEANSHCRIIGIGSSLGSRRITNNELEARPGIMASEIETKTGVKYRFHCDPKLENLCVLMASAADQSLKSANKSVEEINGIFSACNPTGDFLLPNVSSIVASLLNSSPFYNGGNATGCSGGLIALGMAQNKLVDDSLHGRIKNYLVIAGDETSVIIRQGTPDEMLFSDGASALVISNDKNNDHYYSVKSVDNTTYHEKADALKLKRGNLFLEHDGRAVYAFATRSMKSILRMLGAREFPAGRYFIPHQANLRIIEKLSEGIDPSLVYRDGIINIGNTSPASVFIGLEDVSRKRLSVYNELILATFGEGLTVAVAELTANPGKTLQERENDVQLKEKYMDIYGAKWK